MTAGISGAGRPAERLFRELTGAERPPRPCDGDAELEGRLVEIKQASTNTLNQVRAVKYIPLAAFDTRSSQWYVVSPDDIVRLVANKTRGQHTENPFESATLSLRALDDHAVLDPSDLRQSVLSAIERGDRWPRLRKEMHEIRQRSSELAQESIKRVHRILADGPSA